MRTIDQLIADMPVFAGLEPAQLEFIAGCARNQHVDVGTQLMREGEPADEFFIIRRGAVALQVQAPGRGPLVIETLYEGDVVGWSWLFAPYRWRLEGRTTEPSSLITFDAACLRSKAQADHELGYQLMSRFAANLLEKLQATWLQLLDVYGDVAARV